MKNIELNKKILQIAAPAIINNITVPLLGICDTAIAGHLGSAQYLGAISVGAMMLNVFFWLAGFLRMGTTGLTAQNLGKGNIRGIRLVLHKTLKIAIGYALLVLMFKSPVINVLLSVMSPTSEVGGLADRYFTICVWGIPAQLIVMVVSGWFIGLQTTLVPMVISIGINILNILTSLCLVYGFKFGFDGIAYGTLTANWVGCIGALSWAYFRYRKIRKTEREEKDSGSDSSWLELIKVNGNLIIRSACIMGVTLAVTSVGARLGDTVLAANAVMMQFFLFFSYFMDGFAFSGEALVGKYSGAGEKENIVKTVRELLKWGVGVSLFFVAVYLCFLPMIGGLLTDNMEVLNEIIKYKYWITVLPPVTVLAFIYDGIFVGLTRTGSMMWGTLVGSLIFFLIIILCRGDMTNGLLWSAFELYLFFRGGILAFIFNIYKRKKLYL